MNELKGPAGAASGPDGGAGRGGDPAGGGGGKPSPAGDGILSARGLSKTFVSGQEDILILDKVDLTVSPGASTAVLGASGSGKSTLLYILGGLERPTGGELMSGGRDVYALSDSQRARWRARSVGFVFQFHHLLSEFDALENVAMPLRLAGASRDEAAARAKPLLERVGLAKRLSHRPGLMSGGEQQRVALARALAMGPRILLADEPTGNLDGRNALMVNELIVELARAGGMAAVVVTHNAKLAAMLDRRLVLEGGTLKEG
ncbi:MAG: ABC transporter ATP-binding protein [Deltaproteobacteria bacterium]|jgi:lipoprotein-releasing system ATP-binding protein|nr:ABC transporter ATP-binding protein [Deltaproteobacteria bacterium]